MSDDRIELTVKDRIILENQYRILKALFPEEAEWYEGLRIIVEMGYEMHYSDLNPSINESQLSEDICREVMDILDMYRALNDSFDNLEDKKEIEKEDLQFMGFDGNDGTGRLGYARFLILRQQRWTEVLDGRPGFDLNSHSRVNDMYHRMLDTLSNIGKKYNFTHDEIKRILDAQTHPEHRR
ncbi:MAG: YfbU family protein [Candidatus Hatepunaea meridiana]|nr:YfbU family protein [Candidatus Hatepunaea meridiana]